MENNSIQSDTIYTRKYEDSAIKDRVGHTASDPSIYYRLANQGVIAHPEHKLFASKQGLLGSL